MMFILMNIITMCMSIKVSAQETYEFKLSEDDSFIWEVKELNVHNFEKVFGFEPAFEKGDKTRRTIRDIDKKSFGWSLSVEFWDYKDDFDEDGAMIYEEVYDNPAEYKDNIFIPTPVNDYLAEADDDLPSKYIVEGAKVTQRESEYTIVREYDTRGFLALEEYTDDDGIVLIRAEATFRTIPMSNSFIGFIVLAIVCIIFVMIKKKKFLIKKV